MGETTVNICWERGKNKCESYIGDDLIWYGFFEHEPGMIEIGSEFLTQPDFTEIHYNNQTVGYYQSRKKLSSLLKIVDYYLYRELSKLLNIFKIVYHS